jgi:AcrR family transcriptional regulator
MGVRDRKAREFRRREEDLLQAALALSNRDDWQSVTIEQIARKAEIGKGTVYKHFATKDEIYARLALDFHGLVLRRLEAIAPSLPPLDGLREVVRVYWEVYGANAQYQRVVEYCQRPDFQRTLSADLRRAMQAVDAGFAGVIHGIARKGVAARLLPNRPLPLMLFGAQAALTGALKLLWIGCLSGPREPYLEELSAFILAGLTRPPPSARSRKSA